MQQLLVPLMVSGGVMGVCYAVIAIVLHELRGDVREGKAFHGDLRKASKERGEDA